jgi:ATP-binding cassette subfamily B protein RaxB
LRAIQTIKIMGAEAERQSDWANFYADTIRTAQNSTFATLAFNTLHDLFGSAANIAVIGLGVLAVMKGHMTVGMLYAFMAYQTQFLSRASSLFDQVAAWRMLDLYTTRLADVVLTPALNTREHGSVGLAPIEGRVRLKAVSFRYSLNEAPIFNRFNLDVLPGEFVAITGPSGCGKSTLLKVIAGLYPTSSGQVLLDELPLGDWGVKALRQAIGAVLQDDELLSGSIADNVGMFSANTDHGRVWACLEAAAIEEEVRRMPMRADTLVGDMGLSLSGGQKQRVLLARALYRQPKILLLDEATSHLNTELEVRISKTLSRLEVTRIVVAHRPETIAAADRQIAMGDNLQRVGSA